MVQMGKVHLNWRESQDARLLLFSTGADDFVTHRRNPHQFGNRLGIPGVMRNGGPRAEGADTKAAGLLQKRK
jgi:hypothetical protein